MLLAGKRNHSEFPVRVTRPLLCDEEMGGGGGGGATEWINSGKHSSSASSELKEIRR